jgi:methionyl-tRNA formyltransferase
LRLVFAGTPEFARVALTHLHAAGHDIALVLTQPDRPAGRGMKLQPSAVKQFAQEHQLAVAQPTSLRLDGKFASEAQTAQALMSQARAQAMVVVAYGLLLPQWVLDAMAGPGKYGCFNIHASLLPRWRGAAPIHRAIEAGDTESGVTIMQMDAGLDTGPMLLQERMAIAPDASTATLHDALASMGARLMVQTLENPAAWRALAQSNEGVCYAHKIDKTEAQIDWQQSAAHIARKVRAFDPFPGASARLGGETLKIWGAQVVAPSEMASIANETLALGTANAVNQSEVVLISAGVAHTNIGADPSIRPGQILASGPHGLRVAAGHGSCLCITHLQRPGGKRLAVADFLQGHPVAPGLCFDGPAALRTA